MRISRAVVIAATSVAFSLAPACKKGEDDDDEEDEETSGAPASPSPYTLSLDVSMDDDEVADGLFFHTTTAGTNAATAALVLGATSLHVSAAMAVPVAALTRALQDDPTRVSAGVWLWSYDFSAEGATWTANLTATAEGNATNWSMAMTRTPARADGCCDNFVFFTGVQAAGGQSGTWQVFDPKQSDEPSQLLQVAYDYTSADERTLTFTVNSDKPASERFGNGSTVGYTVTADAFTLVVDDSSDDGEHTIVVNRGDKSGIYTGADGTQRCWGPLSDDQPNVACE